MTLVEVSVRPFVKIFFFVFFFFGRKCKCDFNDSRIIRKELSYSSQHRLQYISVTVHSNWNKSCVNAGIITLQLKTRDILTHFGTLGLFDWEANANHPLWYSVKIIFFFILESFVNEHSLWHFMWIHLFVTCDYARPFWTSASKHHLTSTAWVLYDFKHCAVKEIFC